MRLSLGFIALAAALLPCAGTAHAAGFDTPILYTARHQGMGGTAIGYVDDPSAGFHNPAGLSGIRRHELLGDFSLLIGRVRSSPDNGITSVQSESVLAPFFMLAGGARVSDWLTLGLGVFPVASGGAEYRYTTPANTRFIDSTEIVFAELTPFASVELPRTRALPGRLSFGVGYRASALFFTREKGLPSDPRVLDLHMNGLNFSGVRVGLQYRPTSYFSVGFVFRNQIRVTARADEVTVFTQTARDAALDFVLPAKIGTGMAFDIEDLRLATDAEYAFQNENNRSQLTGTLNSTPASVPNVFAWQDGITLRFGAQYRVHGGALSYPLRIGYVFDSAVTSAQYPSAFGTPPAPTHTLSAGAGLRRDGFELNIAVSQRFGSTTIDPSDLRKGCAFCSYAGRYAIQMTGLYLDSSVEF